MRFSFFLAAFASLASATRPTEKYSSSSISKYQQQPPPDAPTTEYAPIPEWFKKANVGFAFAGSAALFPYYLGVAYALVDSGAIIRGVTPIGGLSGGAVTGTLVHSMMDFEPLYKGMLGMMENCNQAEGDLPPCYQGVYRAMVSTFAKLLPDDIHLKTINKNILRVAVTLVDERAPGMNVSRPMVIGRVRSKEAMLRVLGASTYIPCVSGPHPYTLFEGLPVMDGGYSAKYPHLCPEGTDICIKVGSFYIGPHTLNFGGDNDRDCVANEVNPGAWPVRAVSNPWRSAADLASTALDEEWDPRNITVPFAKYGFLPQSCSAPEIANVPFAKPGQANIYPGKYPQNPIPYTCKQWQDLSFHPTANDFANMVKLGTRDVALWLQELALVAAPASGAAS
jgi:hypothetical protein